jgi:CheY-like chemotaxis protein
VLVVDDVDTNRAVLRGLLEDAGCEVAEASDGASALAYVEQERGRVVLVLLDCAMPGLDGYQVARELRRREEVGGFPRLTVVAVTAHAMPGDDELCRAAGMDDYLTKPVQPDHLERVLAQWAAPTPKPVLEQDTIDALRRLEGPTRPGFFANLVATWSRDAEVRVAALTPGADREVLRQQAHALKGASRNLGARRVADEAAALEALVEVPGADVELVAACERVREAYLATLPALQRLARGEERRSA